MISSAARKSARSAIQRASRVALRTSARRVAGLRLRPLRRSYTTERVVEFRSKRKGIPTLYDATRETENCGVGLVASLKSVASRRVVEDADEMLVRMSHRGGVGCDPASGDGAGEYCSFSRS